MQQEFHTLPTEAVINLNEVTVELWRGKIWILSITLISMLAGIAFLSSPLGNQSEAVIDVEPLLADDLKRYALLNKNGVVTIDNHTLLSNFVDVLRLRHTLAQAIIDSKYMEKRGGESDNEFQRRIAQTSNAIKLQPSTAIRGDNTDQRFWRISIRTHDPKGARRMIKLALAITNENVRLSVVKSVSSWLDVYNATQKHERQDLGIRRSNAIEDYDRKIERRISFLKEQLQLARSLDIEKNALEMNNIGSPTTYVANISDNRPYYFHGYLAIAKEIEQLNNRERKEHFVLGLLAIDRESRELEQDKTIERIGEAQFAANLTRENFLAAYYNVDTMIFKSRINRVVALVFLGLFGFILGAIGYLVGQNIRRRSRRV